MKTWNQVSARGTKLAQHFSSPFLVADLTERIDVGFVVAAVVVVTGCPSNFTIHVYEQVALAAAIATPKPVSTFWHSRNQSHSQSRSRNHMVASFCSFVAGPEALCSRICISIYLVCACVYVSVSANY